MGKKAAGTVKRDELALFKHLSRLLKTIREHSLLPPQEQSKHYIFQQCCETLDMILDCTTIWAGCIKNEECALSVYSSVPQDSTRYAAIQHHLASLLIDRFGCQIDDFNEPVYFFIDAENPDVPGADNHYCLVWPVTYQKRRFGFLAMHCRQKNTICKMNLDVIGPVIDEVALALFSQDNSLRLKQESEFSSEIMDTVQALMVSIHPCGTIHSFNRQAEKVTGYAKEEVAGKYWVDVLINPYNRKKFQRLFAKTLRDDQENINFKAPLLSKNGTEHFISWHRSIRHDIQTGSVGLVMIGIDKTETIAADQQLHSLTARWEKIFNAIHDPVLVVSNDNLILDANPAACAAARKRREEVIGRKVCSILHLGHAEDSPCPLEQFIGYQQTRISETELPGLQGTYMLTVSPLLEENGEINATLLVARNLTKEEEVRAEAIRVAQLAAIGELASGVAHEINNPINTIINYAQIILDDPEDEEAPRNLDNIISEGKRIAGIVTNLLSFARCREELHSPAAVGSIIANSLQLVTHLLKRDGIIWQVDIDESLPTLVCNEHQLQQVVLNLLSNARFALNKRFPRPCPEKRLEISASLVNKENHETIRLIFTDHGIGIDPNIQDRLFDPFFSTKPKGEGTGLGLSVSYGLIKDHGGHIKVQSKQGEYTTFIIDLPVQSP